MTLHLIILTKVVYQIIFSLGYLIGYGKNPNFIFRLLKSVILLKFKLILFSCIILRYLFIIIFYSSFALSFDYFFALVVNQIDFSFHNFLTLFNFVINSVIISMFFNVLVIVLNLIFNFTFLKMNSIIFSLLNWKYRSLLNCDFIKSLFIKIEIICLIIFNFLEKNLFDLS